MIAKAFTKCAPLIAAAHLGKAMNEASEIEARARHEEVVGKLVDKLKENIAKDSHIPVSILK